LKDWRFRLLRGSRTLAGHDQRSFQRIAAILERIRPTRGSRSRAVRRFAVRSSTTARLRLRRLQHLAWACRAGHQHHRAHSRRCTAETRARGRLRRWHDRRGRGQLRTRGRPWRSGCTVELLHDFRGGRFIEIVERVPTAFQGRGLTMHDLAIHGIQVLLRKPANAIP
jgi:hypothetical protein